MWLTVPRMTLYIGQQSSLPRSPNLSFFIKNPPSDSICNKEGRGKQDEGVIEQLLSAHGKTLLVTVKGVTAMNAKCRVFSVPLSKLPISFPKWDSMLGDWLRRWLINLAIVRLFLITCLVMSHIAQSNDFHGQGADCITVLWSITCCSEFSEKLSAATQTFSYGVNSNYRIYFSNGYLISREKLQAKINQECGGFSIT